MMTYEEMHRALDALYQTHSHRFSCRTEEYARRVVAYLQEVKSPIRINEVQKLLTKSASVAQHPLTVLTSSGVLTCVRNGQKGGGAPMSYALNDVTLTYLEDVFDKIRALVAQKLEDTEDVVTEVEGRADKIVNSARLTAPTSIFDLRVQNFPISCQQSL